MCSFVSEQRISVLWLLPDILMCWGKIDQETCILRKGTRGHIFNVLGTIKGLQSCLNARIEKLHSHNVSICDLFYIFLDVKILKIEDHCCH